MIGISENRLKHSLTVARLMKQLSETVMGWDEKKSKEMFTLGFLHDIGYEYSDVQEKHAFIGGEILKDLGYKYWIEVYYHGILTNEYDSDELNLLNIADFHVTSEGVIVNPQGRLNDIMKNYGEDSYQYKNAFIFAKHLEDGLAGKKQLNKRIIDLSKKLFNQ